MPKFQAGHIKAQQAPTEARELAQGSDDRMEKCNLEDLAAELGKSWAMETALEREQQKGKGRQARAAAARSAYWTAERMGMLQAVVKYMWDHGHDKAQRPRRIEMAIRDFFKGRAQDLYPRADDIEKLRRAKPELFKKPAAK